MKESQLKINDSNAQRLNAGFLNSIEFYKQIVNEIEKIGWKK